MEHFKNLRRDLQNAKEKSDVMEVLYEISEVLRGKREYSLTPACFTVIVNESFLTIANKKFADLETEELLFMATNFYDYVLPDRFENMCIQLMNEYIEPEHFSRILIAIETLPSEDTDDDLVKNLMPLVNDYIADNYDGNQYIPIIISSENVTIQNNLWNLIEKRNISEELWGKLFGDAWFVVSKKIFVDMYNYWKKLYKSKPFGENLIMDFLRLYPSVQLCEDEEIDNIVIDLCESWPRIKNPENLVCILEILEAKSLITYQTEEAILSILVKMQPETETLERLELNGLFTRLKNLDAELLRTYGISIEQSLTENTGIILSEDDEAMVAPLGDDPVYKLYLMHNEKVESENFFEKNKRKLGF